VIAVHVVVNVACVAVFFVVAATEVAVVAMGEQEELVVSVPPAWIQSSKEA